MKIALIDPSLFTWPYDEALAKALIDEGNEVTLYTKYLSEIEQGKGAIFVRELFYPGFQTNFLKNLPKSLFLALKGVAHIYSLCVLWLILRQDKPDVIHFQWAPLPVIDRLFLSIFKKIAPIILTVHDSSPFNNNPKSRLQAMGAIDIMRDYDALIVHTEKAKDSLRRYGISESVVTRIEHGVLGMEMPKSEGPKLQDDDKPVTILLFGHLKPYKGADLLIEALGLMSPEIRSKSKLHIVGKPQMDTEPLFALARQYGVEKNIQWDLRFVGDDQIGEIFANADITAMPYREIDASGVLMVSLSIGRPIVASRIGLFAEILEDGKHGYLVPQEDPKALAAALEKLIQSPDLRVEMGRNVQDLGNSIPAWSDIARKTLSLYAKMIAKAA